MPTFSNPPSPADYVVTESGASWAGHPIRGADPSSFSALNSLWATDANAVYCRNSRLRGVDPRHFRILNEIFARDDRYIYCGSGVARKVIDPATFTVLDTGRIELDDGVVMFVGYARDSQAVYYHDRMEGSPRPLRGADPTAFRVLQYGYALDRSLVYALGYRLPKASPATFVVLGPHHSHDGVRVYYGEQLIAGADARTFEVVLGLCGKDRTSVYLRAELVHGAEPASFLPILGEFLARDAQHVFWHGKALPDVTPDAFIALGEGYFRSSTAVYWHGEKFPDADPETFVVIPRLTPEQKRAYWSGSYQVKYQEAIDGYTAMDSGSLYKGSWTKPRAK